MADGASDELSLDLAIRLQLQELGQLQGRRGNGLDDWSVAMNEFQLQLTHAARSNGDAVYVRSLVQAERLSHTGCGCATCAGNFTAVQISHAGYNYTTYTNSFTVECSCPTCANNIANSVAINPHDTQSANRTNPVQGRPNGRETQRGESSRQGAASDHNRQKAPCLACQDEFHPSDLANLQCRHQYCGDCLDNLFKASVQDESLFPPRCCQIPISLDAVRSILSADAIAEFERRAPELSTPNRTYCSRPRCSAWVPPSQIQGDIATCAVCRTQTCTICKQASHNGDCPQDRQVQELLTQARSKKWQHCPQCRILVEHNDGCFHMTCRCGAQFCYLCGTRWKDCDCPRGPEDRLVLDAQQIFDRGQPTPQAAPRPPEFDRALEPPPVWTLPGRGAEPDIRTLMENLNYECEHESWTWTSGRHHCEECFTFALLFMYRCRQCHLRICRECRHNRW